MTNLATTADGLDAAETALFTALKDYLDHGGTVARARALLDLAAENVTPDHDTTRGGHVLAAPLPAAGQSERVHLDHRNIASAGTPDDGGADRLFGDADASTELSSAPPPPASGDEARLGSSKKDQKPTASPPSAARLRAAGRVAQAAARTVLDSFKTRDGTAIGDIRVDRLRSLAARREKSAWVDAREAELYRRIAAHVGHAPAAAQVRDVVDADTLQGWIEASATVADMRGRISLSVVDHG